MRCQSWNQQLQVWASAALLVICGTCAARATEFDDIKQFMQGLPQTNNPNTTKNEVEESKTKITTRINGLGRKGIRISVNSNQQYINPALTQHAINIANGKQKVTYLSPAQFGSQIIKAEFDNFKNKCDFISVYNESGTNNFPDNWNKGSAKCCGPDTKDLRKTVEAGWSEDTQPDTPGNQPGLKNNNPYSRYDIVTSHNLDDPENGIQGGVWWDRLRQVGRGKNIWDSECLPGARLDSARAGNVNSVVHYSFN